MTIPVDPTSDTYDLKIRGGVIRLRYMSLREWRAFCPTSRRIDSLVKSVREGQAHAEDLIDAICVACEPYVSEVIGLGRGLELIDHLRVGEHWQVYSAILGQNIQTQRDAEKNSPSPSPSGTAAAGTTGPAGDAPAAGPAVTSPPPSGPSSSSAPPAAPTAATTARAPAG